MLRIWILAILSVVAPFAPHGVAQTDANLNSTEVLPDHRVVFRIYAPKANWVTVSGDFVTQGRGAATGKIAPPSKWRSGLAIPISRG